MPGFRQNRLAAACYPLPRLWAALALLAVIGAALALNNAYGGVPEVLAHRVSLHPQNSLIAEMQITLSDTAQVFIEYENPAAGKFVTALSEPGTEHHIPVVRLRPETAYAYTIGIQAGHGGRAYGPAGEFTAGPLPPELAGMQIRAAGRSSQPLIATDYKDGLNLWYFLWDETGNIVWYYRVPDLAEIPGLENLEDDLRNHALRQRPNGNLLYVVTRCCIIEITPLGEIVDWIQPRAPQGQPHHDFLLLDDGRILYLSQVYVGSGVAVNGPPADTPVLVDRLHLWNPADGSIAEAWDARNSWNLSDPGRWAVQPFNNHWLHINTLSVGPGGRLALTLRKQHQIAALSPDFSRVEWQLGGLGSDYEFPNPGDRFYGPHTATQLPNGNLLLFDNGRLRPYAEGGAYSRALELRLDDAAGTAVKVWEYRPSPDLYAGSISSAFRLSSGHTLVNFGINSAGSRRFAPLTFLEANRQGDEVFRVETFSFKRGEGNYPRRYRATAEITAIMGETMLRPPAPPPGGGVPPEGGWRDWPEPELAARLAALTPVVSAPFALYLDGRRLIYRKQPCTPAEAAHRFFLQLFPANPGDLPEESRESGFERREFRFEELGVIEDGECLAEALLPEYPIDRIRAGQYAPGGVRLWEAEFPGPGTAAAE